MSIKKIWKERSYDIERAQSLSQELNIPLLLAKMLLARNVTNKNEAEEFLNPRLKNLLEPLLLKDMDKAVLRIGHALNSYEKIGIFGDYDVDGVCSVALLQQFFTSINKEVDVTLPHRMSEGYGLSYAGIERLKAKGANLIITVDCGSVAYEQIDYARTLDLDVIVVDHHNLGDRLPNAYAIVNPKRVDCEANAHYLCASGVSFFLCIALRRFLREKGYFYNQPEPDVRELLDLVAMATVCDVVPLIKDNRCMVKAGLNIIKEGKRIGLLALLNTCNIKKEKISSTNLGFYIGPRINAAGRLDDATAALLLMNCTDANEAKKKADELDRTNQERRLVEEEMVKEVCELVDTNYCDVLPRILVFHKEDWHPGVVGIVASRIAERYHRPAIVIGQNGKGSGRSIKGIDLHYMVAKSSASLLGFGGHSHAIGVTLGPKGILVFRDDILLAMEEIKPQVFEKEMLYDAIISTREVNLSLIDGLISLEPFGALNPYPVVRINNCFFKNLKRLEGGHIKGDLESSDGVVSFIGFRMNIDDELANCAFDVQGVLERNEWQGRCSAQLRLSDFKKSEIFL